MRQKFSVRETLTNWLPDLLEEAEKGCTDSMKILGYMYTRGYGVEKDVERGSRYFQMEKDHLSGDLTKFQPPNEV